MTCGLWVICGCVWWLLPASSFVVIFRFAFDCAVLLVGWGVDLRAGCGVGLLPAFIVGFLLVCYFACFALWCFLLFLICF